MRRFFIAAGLLFGLTGAAIGVAAAWRIEQIFTANSFRIGYGKEYDTWFWNHSLIVSFCLVLVGFICESIAFLLESRDRR
jgi:cell division protein FtsX